MDQFGGGSWSMIPSIPTHSNPTTPSNQDHLFLQQHQFQQQQQQFQQPQQFHQLPQQQRYQHPQQQQQQQPQPSQSLASHFHLLNLVENFADAIENGTRDQHFDTLVTELSGQFDKCQQLLNTISGSITTKSTWRDKSVKWMNVSNCSIKEGARAVRNCKFQVTIYAPTDTTDSNFRDLIAKYRNSVEELTKSEL